MLIKIIKGTYGLHVNDSVIAKDVNSPPFEVDDIIAAELVLLEVAAKVETVVKTGVAENNVFKPDSDDTNGQGDVETGKGDNNGFKPDGDDADNQGSENTKYDKSDKPEYDADSKCDELRAIAKNYFDVSFKVGTTKAEMLAKLDELFADSEDEEDDADSGESFPNLTADGPV